MKNCLPLSRNHFDAFYLKYNRREYVHPDPIEFLYRYKDVSDREIAGLIASSLAYGRVKQIFRNLSLIMEKLGDNPALFLKENKSLFILERTFEGFKHRFTRGEEVALLLFGIKKALEKFGSLNECFLSGLKKDAHTVLPALISFVHELSAGGRPPSLLPLPERGGASKRLNLYLRWMVRRDAVDPGGWKGISRAKLIIPLDTHMHRVCRGMHLTERKAADMKTALEITSRFCQINPQDPVKYDFSLTRPGILNDRALKKCLREYFVLEPDNGRSQKIDIE